MAVNVFTGKDHLNLIVTDVASVLGFNQPVVKFPKRLILFPKFLSECGDDGGVP